MTPRASRGQEPLNRIRKSNEKIIVSDNIWDRNRKHMGTRIRDSERKREPLHQLGISNRCFKRSRTWIRMQSNTKRSSKSRLQMRQRGCMRFSKSMQGKVQNDAQHTMRTEKQMKRSQNTNMATTYPWT